MANSSLNDTAINDTAINAKDTATSLATTPRRLYLIGLGTGHSVAPPLHNYIAQSLNLPWTYHTKDCFTIDDCVDVLRSEICVGAAITMPYKSSIIGRLDEVDELARVLEACNTVSVGPDGRLKGTNVDWCGIAGSLDECSIGLSLSPTKAALIIGAGGAARAAVYALSSRMGCQQLYILNRDAQEVSDLQRDVERQYTSSPSIIHITSHEQVETLPTPTYIVGTVPDLEPVTNEERHLKVLLAAFLERPQKGILLDMCYMPRRTRHIKLGQQFGWRTIEGIRVVFHQAEQQWRAWVGDARLQALDKKGMWQRLQQSADKSLQINSKA